MAPTKVCKSCAAEKPVTDFNRHPTTRDRLQHTCKPCHRAQSRAYAAANPEIVSERNRRHYAEHREERITASKRWFQENKERARASQRARYKRNPTPMLEATKRWEKKNPEKARARQRAYAAANPHKMTMYTARKRAERQRMPAWANRFFIDEIYSLAALRTKMLGVLHTVDHSVPLFGKTVSGLHVENNMRVIPHVENARKGNRAWPDMPERIAHGH